MDLHAFFKEKGKDTNIRKLISMMHGYAHWTEFTCVTIFMVEIFPSILTGSKPSQALAKVHLFNWNNSLWLFQTLIKT